jgi:hypothetical protein
MNNPGTEIIICGGNAQPTDTNLLSTVHCIDEEIFEFLKRRERRKRTCHSKIAEGN